MRNKFDPEVNFGQLNDNLSKKRKIALIISQKVIFY